MTLIASYVLNSHPIIIGDLLLTRNASGAEASTQIPSIRDINKELRGKREISVVGLRQKVNLVSENFCVAWTGSFIHAKSLIQSFREATQGQVISEEQYNDILNSVPLEDTHGVEMLTYHYDVEKNRFSRRNLNMPHFELGQAVDVQVGGTGTAGFIEQFEHFQDFNIVGEANHLAQAVGQTLALCNAFWGLETLIGGGVGDGWGGGFETVYFSKGRFHKLSNVLYLYWEARQLEGDGFDLRFRSRLMKVDYQNENMLIRMSDGDEGEMTDSLFVVSPMFTIPTREEVDIPDYTYEWLNSFVRLQLLDGSYEYLSTVNRYGGTFRPVVIESTPKMYEMAFHDSYLSQILNSIREKIS